MLNDGTAYTDLGPDHFHKDKPLIRAEALARQIERLGFACPLSSAPVSIRIRGRSCRHPTYLATHPAPEDAAALAEHRPVGYVGSINHAVFEELIDKYIDAGVHGLVLGAGASRW